jgi:hypothetical protein
MTVQNSKKSVQVSIAINEDFYEWKEKYGYKK